MPTISTFGGMAARAFGFSQGGVTAYVPAATALFARMSPAPSAARKSLINSLIANLQSGGIWAKLDVLYILGADTQFNALLNWTSTSNQAGAHGGYLFTTDRGFTGDGSSAYLNSGSYGIGSGQFTQDNHAAGVWMRTIAAANAYNFGIDDFLTTGVFIAVESFIGGGIGTSDGNTGNQHNFSFTGTGSTILSRPSHNSFTAYGNGALLGSLTEALPSSSFAPFYILAVNEGTGSPVSASSSQALAFHAGAYLTATDVSNLYNALGTYFTAIGAYP